MQMVMAAILLYVVPGFAGKADGKGFTGEGFIGGFEYGEVGIAVVV